MMTPDEITAFIAATLGRNIQDEIEGIVALNDDGSNPAESFEYTIPVQVKDQPEVLYARYDPLADATAFSNGSPVKLSYNEDGELEARFDARRGRQAYGGVIPTRNMLFMQHTHQSASTGGLLAANLIFSSGQVLLEYGGTEANLSATGAGHLIQATAGANVSVIKDNLAATVAPTVNEDSGDGYAIGSLWLDTTNDNIYMAIDVSVGAAIWRQINNAGASPFTHSGGLIYPTTTTDNMTLGGSTNIAKLGIIGDTDEPQLIVRGNGTQTAAIVDIQNSATNSLFKITSSALIINDGSIDLDVRIESDGDVNAFVVDGGTGRIGVGILSPGGRLNVFGASDVVQLLVSGATGQTLNPVVSFTNDVGGPLFNFYNDGSVILDGTLTVNSQFANVGGGFVVNEGGGNNDSRFEGDTDANLLFLDASADSIQIGGNAPTDYLHLKASTTAASSLRMPTGTAPTSPNDGARWRIANRGEYVRHDGMTQGQVKRIYGQYTTVGGSNTTSAINLIGGSVIGSASIAAGMWFQGRSFHVRARGYVSTGGIARDLTLALRLDGVNVVNQTITALSVVTAGRVWVLDVMINCYTVSSSGTVFTQGWGFMGNVILERLENTTTTTHDMTGALPVTLVATFATANSNTQIQCTNLDILAIA